MPPNQRHTYEIIVDSERKNEIVSGKLIGFYTLEKPSKLYFDLEYEKAWNPTLDGPKLTSNFIQVRYPETFQNKNLFFL